MEFSNKLKLSRHGLVLTLTSKNTITTLHATKNALDQYYDEIRARVNEGNEDRVLTFFRLILIDYPSTTMSMQERPSWCATRFKDADEYRDTKDDNGFPIFQTRKYKHFLTFEKWCDAILEYYDK